MSKGRPYRECWPEPGVLFEGMPISSDDVVIDVGFGEGEAIVACAELGARVIATDIRAEAVEAIARRLTAVGAKFEAFVSDAAPLPIPNETVTRVISTQVIEHVDDPDRFLSELVRIGRSGALYFLAAPDAAGEHLVKRIAHPIAFQKPHHIHIIKREEFAEMVTRAGLIVERRAYCGFADLMSWLMFWIDEEAKSQPLRDRWGALWNDIRGVRDGATLERILDEAWPKDQIIVARKP